MLFARFFLGRGAPERDLAVVAPEPHYRCINLSAGGGTPAGEAGHSASAMVTPGDAVACWGGTSLFGG